MGFPLDFAPKAANDRDPSDRRGPDDVLRDFRTPRDLRSRRSRSAMILTLPPPVFALNTPIAVSMAVTVAVILALMSATVGLSIGESRRRRRMLQSIVRGVDATAADSKQGGSELEAGRDRGRPATLRRRRGGEWDTPVVPTISTSPHRRERRRTRRI